jgi:hypothetical protein
MGGDPEPMMLMKTTHCSFVFAAILMLLASQENCSAANQQPKDTPGEPLPPGAIARLGSNQMQVGGACRIAILEQPISIGVSEHWLAPGGGFVVLRCYNPTSALGKWRFAVPHQSHSG